MQDIQAISGILTFGADKVHCLRMGTGKELLIAFHGFGSDAAAFKILLPYLNNNYTLVAIDLPGHGKTEWQSRYFNEKALMAIVQGIKNDFETEKISVIGHSLGGKMALSVAALQPSWIKKLILLAADGLEKNFWYHFATRNPLGKYLFKSILKQPERWLKRLVFLKKLKIVSEAQYKLASLHSLNKQLNARVAYVWPVMSRLNPVPGIVQWNIKKYKIETHVFAGRRDPICSFAAAKKFTHKLKYSQLHALDAGHHLLTPEFLPRIANCL